MQSSYFPMFVDISDKNIVVIGGGKIAARRVNTLLMFNQRLTIVSPFLCEELQSVQGKIHWIPCEYTQECLRGMDIVLAATNQREINQQVATDCRILEQKEQRRILVNIADNKKLCDFYFPGVVQADEVTIGINSGGQNPRNVKKVRKKIQEMLKDLDC